MKRTVAHLADGREIIYFDERDAPRPQTSPAAASVVDRRDLPEPPPASELRYDPLTEEWVAIAAHRQTRTFLPPSDQCPLCPSTPERSTEIPAYDYDVAVFENRFPAFSHRVESFSHPVESFSPGMEPSSHPGSSFRPVGSEAGLATPLHPTRPGEGRCEVVCFTADHNASFASLPPERVRTVLDVLADRTAELSALPYVEQVFCFENRGVEIGVTLHHPHGQIYAYPFVTPRTRTMLAAAHGYAERTGGANLFADVLAAERAAEIRVVAENAHWTAYVPAAARWPFEVHLVPHRQVPDIPALDEAERAAFAPIYLDLLRRFDALFDEPMPYISAWHQAPVRTLARTASQILLATTTPVVPGEPAASAAPGAHRAASGGMEPTSAQRPGVRASSADSPDPGSAASELAELAYLHLQLFSIRRAPGKLKYLAGSESGMGVFINDIRPEDAAQLLRKALP